jgi:hypothetical protein
MRLAFVKSQPLPLPDRSTEYLIGNSGAKEPSVLGPCRKTRRALSGCLIASLTAVLSYPQCAMQLAHFGLLPVP